MSGAKTKSFDKPGHEAWVVGDEPVIAYEFGGVWGE